MASRPTFQSYCRELLLLLLVAATNKPRHTGAGVGAAVGMALHPLKTSADNTANAGTVAAAAVVSIPPNDSTLRDLLRENSCRKAVRRFQPLLTALAARLA